MLLFLTMKILSPSGGSRESAIAEAADVIRSGGIVAFPTETFYGLGVKYDDAAALARLYDLKRRPAEKAMPLIIGDRSQLSAVAASVSAVAEILMNRFWPGPLTLLFPAKEGLNPFITAESGKVAVRIPGSSFALDLTQQIGFPITATSANLSGEPPASDPATVGRYFGTGLDLLVSYGRTPGGRPSTIVDVTSDDIAVMRQGAVPESRIREALSAGR